MSKRILILSFSDLKRDPRVQRQIQALISEYQVIAAGFSHPDIQGVEFIEIPVLPTRSIIPNIAVKLYGLVFRQFEAYYWHFNAMNSVYNQLNSKIYDLIIANDLDALPLAVRLAQHKNIKLHYDAHEFSPREFEDLWRWKLIYQPYKTYLCKHYLPFIHSMSTVCDGLSQEYQKQFKSKNIFVMPNASNYYDLQVSETQVEKIRMIHHGVAIPSRKIECMIELMKHLDQRFHLDLMLVPTNRDYYSFLENLVSEQSRIQMISPVKFQDIVPFCNSYDIGLFLLPPTSFNYQFALPNKIFEFIQSRLAVAIGPSPEMAKIVNKYNCGVISSDFSPRSLAKELNKLTNKQVIQFKKNSFNASKEVAFEKIAPEFVNRIRNLFS